MGEELKKQKIEMWTKKLTELEKRLDTTIIRRGEAALMGDLRENAAFQDADEESAVLRKRIADVKKILADLGVKIE